MMSEYHPQMILRDYQVEAIEKMRGRSAFALLMAMRTGKTCVALTDFGAMELDGLAHDLLVIAPAGVYRTWEEAIREHVSTDLLDRLSVFTWQTSIRERADCKRWLEHFLAEPTGPRILLVNVEALSVASCGARAACERFLSAPGRRHVLVIDESTAIKNYRAKRTRYIVHRLAPMADYRRILSGLPTPRSPLDIFCQFEFLDPRIIGHRSFATFRAEYAVVKQITFSPQQRSPAQIVVGYRNVERLRSIIEPHSHRVEFRPRIPSTYSTRAVAMTEEQTRVYKEFKKFATAQLAGQTHVTATIVIVQMLRLHQILMGHVADEEGVVREIPENRTAALLELLSDYSGKAVIWCSYDHDVEKITSALCYEFGSDKEMESVIEARNGVVITSPPANGGVAIQRRIVARFWGGNRTTREAEEIAFKTDPDCRFMVATPASGGMGRTWDVADLVVYYSSTNNLEHREQSERRVQGVNKERQVDYVDLICPDTVETRIIEALRKKIDLAAQIAGDDFRKWLI